MTPKSDLAVTPSQGKERSAIRPALNVATIIPNELVQKLSAITDPGVFSTLCLENAMTGTWSPDTG
jgi:hypothetical protein